MTIAIPMIVILMLMLSLLTSIDAYAFTTIGLRERGGDLRCRNRGYMSMGLRARIWDKVKGIVGRGSSSKRTDDELKSGIAKFYDESSGIWLDVWGEHMHHGYYPQPDYKDHKAAQIDMIDRAVNWAYDKDLPSKLPKSMIDVGCGVGGSSRHISQRFGCIGKGISLSPFQIEKANEFTKNAKLDDKLQYMVADAMKMPFNENTFDLTWSMESGEHMPDKEQFLKELIRVTAPGGRIIIVTWCHRELNENETSLSEKEQKLLNKINDAYYLPDWVPASKYVSLAKSMGLEDIRQDDWSEFIAPFWPAVFFSSLVPSNFFRLMRTGSTTIKGAIATLWMLRGFKKNVVKFALITGRKKESS